MTCEVTRMQLLIDALYEQFTGVKQKVSKQTTATSQKAKVIGWTLGVVLTLAIVVSVIIGLIIPAITTAHTDLLQLTSANNERNMLLELSTALQREDKWNLTVPHCSWRGISCNETTGRVIGINLAYTSSRSLKRDTNYPTIPASIGNFTELKFLNLSFNKLQSTIPESIKLLKNLVHLKLGSNTWLKGTLPDLSNLTKLQEVHLDDTLVTISQRTFNTLMNLPSIEILYLTNPITGTLPQSVSPSLLTLVLTGCELHGTIPKSWEYSNIQALDLSRNKLSGSIPCLGKNIEHFSAVENDFDGEFCGSGFNHYLQGISLDDMKLKGTFDLPNVDLQNMDSLLISGNRFTSFLPSSLNTTTGPKHCNVANNPLHCPVPEWAKKGCSAVCN